VSAAESAFLNSKIWVIFSIIGCCCCCCCCCCEMFGIGKSRHCPILAFGKTLSLSENLFIK
jgi:hypothetical protein